jgi:hypothetical protein
MDNVINFPKPLTVTPEPEPKAVKLGELCPPPPDYPEEVNKGLKQYQRDAITTLRARLDTRDPGHGDASEEVEALLNDPRLRCWLDSWVLPLLDVAAGDQWHGQRDYVARDANRVRIRRNEKKRGQDK